MRLYSTAELAGRLKHQQWRSNGEFGGLSIKTKPMRKAEIWKIFRQAEAR